MHPFMHPNPQEHLKVEKIILRRSDKAMAGISKSSQYRTGKMISRQDSPLYFLQPTIDAVTSKPEMGEYIFISN